MNAHVPAEPTGKTYSVGSALHAARERLPSGLEVMSRYGTIIGLVTMVVVFSLSSPYFLTTGNITDILADVAITGMVSCGLTMALITGEFDLSIGYVASFAGVFVTGLIVRQHFSVVEAIALTLIACAGVGLVNGLLVTKAGVNSFIATLGIGTIVVGLNFGYTSGQVVSVVSLPQSFLELALRRVFGVLLPVYIFAGVVIVLWVLVNRTVFGRNAQAVGGNADAARLAGVRVDRVRIVGFVVSAMCAGLGGIVLASKLGSGQLTAADGYLLTAFAASFLGSVALRDGEFHIIGTVIGIIVVGTAFDGLSILNAPAFWQYIMQGTLLVAAVAISTIARRFKASASG